jgi:hypothetical protein
LITDELIDGTFGAFLLVGAGEIFEKMAKSPDAAGLKLLYLRRPYAFDRADSLVQH